MRFARRIPILSLFVLLSACPAGSTQGRDEGAGNGEGSGGSEEPNGAPVVAGVKLNAGPYYVSTSITATPGSASDPDGDSVTLKYQWFVNDAAVDGAETESLAGAFAPGDRVHVEVMPSDGVDDGAAVASATVTIENRPPTMPFIGLYPAVLVEGPAKTLYTKIVTAATDPDGTALTYAYRWYLDGALQSFSAGQTAVTTTLVSGQTWRVEVVASDGQASSAAVTVSRAVPFVAASIDAGGFACAVTTKGAVLCWGHYADATYSERKRTPVLIEGLASGVTAVAVGRHHACARTKGGGVKCWGKNDLGQLGVGATSSNFLPPLDVIGLTSGIAAIASGSEHACALTTGGGVKCWGYNGNGQLGNGGTVSQSSPVNVTGLASGVRAIVAGGDHTCAVTTSGGVKCWGNNTLTPADISGLTSGVATVATGGSHTCAVTTGGAAKCWGQGSLLGDGTSNASATPVNVAGLSAGVTQIDASHSGYGYPHACALAAGSLKCWGKNQYNQLGVGVEPFLYDSVLAPTAVKSTGKTWTAVTTGGDFTCALTGEGAVYCWGILGNLGNGKQDFETAPVDGVRGVKKLSLSYNNACALRTDDTVACWGTIYAYALGVARDRPLITPSPMAVTAVAGPLVDVAVGSDHLCVLTSAGIVKCMGKNTDGVLGNGNWSSSGGPFTAINLLAVTALAGGEGHTCALEIGGSIKCWGNVGTLTGSSHDTPGVVTAFSGVNVTRMTSGYWMVGLCGIRSDTTAKCFHEQITDQGGVLRDLPIGGVLDVAKESDHGCAVTSAGAVKCFGANYFGQLGNGLAEPSSSREDFTFYDVVGLSSGMKGVATGSAHSCALNNTGGVKCWGRNQVGQLGDGTTTSRTTPVDVVGLVGAAALYAKSDYTCALLTNGDTKCWGAGNFGNLAPETAGWVPYLPVVGFVP